MVKIFSSITAAIGRQLKQSVKIFHSLILYRRLPNREEGDLVHKSGNEPKTSKTTITIEDIIPRTTQ